MLSIDTIIELADQAGFFTYEEKIMSPYSSDEDISEEIIKLAELVVNFINEQKEK